jgi:hypothetical protein
MLVMQEKPGTKRRRAAAAVRSAAAAYRANQEDLGPLVRLVADVLALLALARGRRDKPAARED